MRKLLMACFLALLTGAIAAQQTPRSGLTPTPAPRASAADKQRSNPERATSRSTTPSSPNTRSKPRPDAGARTSTPGATDRSAMTPKTPDTKLRPAATQMMPTYGTPKTTARNVNPGAKNAPPLKPAEPVKINWMSLEEALEKSKTEKKKIFVDVFTDWCGWCKRMDETTFTDPGVAKYLNENYYAVKFNAEQEKEIQFHDKTYKFKKNGSRGYHELAAEWLNNRLSFPTTVFLDENLNVIQPLPGYLEALKLDVILHYFGTNSHKNTPWETYERNFPSQR